MRIIAEQSKTGKGTELNCPTIPTVLDGLVFTYRGVDLNELLSISEIKIEIPDDDIAVMKLTCALEKPMKIIGNGILITDDKIEIDGVDTEDMKKVSIKYISTDYPEICISKYAKEQRDKLKTN